ncbi:hypothetical protein F5880DRAFT_1633710 [Lentinula raphanica]|nr:hypothetical protein F5880DRAFT_1633710 [Lentinula raphanica]
MFVVWQKGKARVVMDQTASGLNDGIPREEAKVKNDDMHTFGQVFNDVIKEHPNEELVLFKSNVAKAFLNLPAHPLWQLCQVVSVDGGFHIVRRLVFGTRTSSRCWCSVSALLCWFGTEKLGIPNLHASVYIDDFFGWDFKRNLIWASMQAQVQDLDHQEKYLRPREPRDTPQKLRLPRLPRDSQRFPKIFKATQNLKLPGILGLDSGTSAQDSEPILQARRDALARLLASSSQPTATASMLPAALLEAAPHLAHLSGPSSLPAHVQKTWELKNLFAAESNLDPVVFLLAA